MRILINGLGWATPAGFGQGRIDGQDPLVPGALEIPTRKQVFAGIDRRFGRLDDFSRLGLAAATFCLRDAEAETWTEKRSIGILASSRYGCLQTDLDYLETMLPEQGKLASPNIFAYTLPNCFLGEAALRFGLTGNSMIVNHRDASRLTAIRLAVDELAWSGQTGVLAGIVDLAPPTENAADDDQPGALFLLIEKEERDGVKPYGELTQTDNDLKFNGTTMTDLHELITACLKSAN